MKRGHACVHAGMCARGANGHRGAPLTHARLCPEWATQAWRRACPVGESALSPDCRRSPSSSIHQQQHVPACLLSCRRLRAMPSGPPALPAQPQHRQAGPSLHPAAARCHTPPLQQRHSAARTSGMMLCLSSSKYSISSGSKTNSMRPALLVSSRPKPAKPTWGAPTRCAHPPVGSGRGRICTCQQAISRCMRRPSYQHVEARHPPPPAHSHTRTHTCCSSCRPLCSGVPQACA